MFKEWKSRVKEFGFVLTFFYIAQELAGKMHFWKIQRKIAKIKEKYIESYLEEKLSQAIEKYKLYDPDYSDAGECKKYAWTFWWQGENNCPASIKMCLSSLKHNLDSVELHVIDKDNIRDWIDLPEFIYDKVKCGEITLTHLSDIVRMNLLNKYGGVWFDATIIMLDEFDEKWLEYYYFTAKQPPKDCLCVSNFRWTGSYLGGKKGNFFFGYMSEAFESYWKEHHCLIDYFLIDFLVDIALKEFDWFKKMYDVLPENNSRMYDLDCELNKRFNKRDLDDICKNGNVYKLQRRTDYKENINGEMTLYGYLCSKYED